MRVRVKVADLRDGDRFEWAGRQVTLVDTKPPRLSGRLRRAARCLIVEETNGTLHQLHYYADETVTVHAEKAART